MKPKMKEPAAGGNALVPARAWGKRHDAPLCESSAGTAALVERYQFLRRISLSTDEIVILSFPLWWKEQMMLGQLLDLDAFRKDGPRQNYFEIDTEESAAKAMHAIAAREPKPKVIIASGMLSIEEFQELRRLLAPKGALLAVWWVELGIDAQTELAKNRLMGIADALIELTDDIKRKYEF